MNPYFENAVELHRYLVARHWNGRALIGPDPGIRFNYRIGRFVKSYFPNGGWRDALYYLQAQGYWTLANWQLFARTGEDTYRNIALRCSDYMLEQQRDDGAWDYPNPEWKGRVATGEGCWAAIGLLESYRQTRHARFLAGVLRWHRYLVEVIGFQQTGDQLAVNYFAHATGSRVPNNSACVLRYLAELADATGTSTYLERTVGLLNFLNGAQKPGGEFPYAVEGVTGSKGRPHFQCQQYNAFQCLELIRYHEITRDMTALPLIDGVLTFLRDGVVDDGRALYECGNARRAVTYHAAALGAALAGARHVGIDGYDALSHRAFAYVSRMRQPDGGYTYSRWDYRLLNDRRSYPRHLAMILHHVLLRASSVATELQHRCAS